MGSRISADFPGDHPSFIQAACAKPKVASLAAEIRSLPVNLTSLDRTVLFDNFSNNLVARDVFAQAVGSCDLEMGIVQNRIFGFSAQPGTTSTQPFIILPDSGTDLLALTIDSERLNPSTAALLLSPRHSFLTAFAPLIDEPYINKVADICCSAFPYSLDLISSHMKQSGAPFEVYNSAPIQRTISSFRETYYASQVSGILAKTNPSRLIRVISASELPEDAAAITLERFASVTAGHMAGMYIIEDRPTQSVVSLINGHHTRISEGRGDASVWSMWATAFSAANHEKSKAVLTDGALDSDAATQIVLHNNFDEKLALEIISKMD